MNWELIGNVAFAVFVALGLVVILGEAIAAGLSRDSVMEGRDDVMAEPDTQAIARREPHFRVPPYIEPELEETGPMYVSTYRSNGDKTVTRQP